MTLPDPALHEALAARADALLAWDEERGEASATIARGGALRYLRAG